MAAPASPAQSDRKNPATAPQQGAAMNAQLRLFEDFISEKSTSVAGLQIVLPHSCRCGETISIAGSSRGPHHARILCINCGVFRAWMSGPTFNFLSAVIDQFGRPVEPIEISLNSRNCVDAPATATER